MHVLARAIVVCMCCAKAAEAGCFLFEGSVLPLSSEALKRCSGVTAMVEVEGSVLHRLLSGIVDSKLRMHKKSIPISHGGRHKVSEHVLNSAIHAICLTISLRVKCC